MKNRYYKITPFGDKKSCYVTEQEASSAVTDWLAGMSTKNGLLIEVVEMDEKEFNNLPEYEI